MTSVSTKNLVLILIALFVFQFGCFAQGLDDKLNEAFMPIANWWDALVFTEVGIGDYSVPLVLIILMGGATFCSFYFKFVNIREFWTAIKVVRGKYDLLESIATNEHLNVNLSGEDIVGTIKDESHHGEVNHFQALATAVSGTVGLGNIAMVAVAIGIGGPGATFWMIVAGLLGMSTKFVECTLGVKYRDIDAEGNVYGGPMYYISKGFKEMGFVKFEKIVSVILAVFCVGASFGGGNAF